MPWRQQMLRFGEEKSKSADSEKTAKSSSADTWYVNLDVLPWFHW